MAPAETAATDAAVRAAAEDQRLRVAQFHQDAFYHDEWSPPAALDSRSCSSRASPPASPPPLRTTVLTPSSDSSRSARFFPSAVSGRARGRSRRCRRLRRHERRLGLRRAHRSRGRRVRRDRACGDLRLSRRRLRRLDDRALRGPGAARAARTLAPRHAGAPRPCRRLVPALDKPGVLVGTDLCPVVRSFVAIPAGILQTALAPFLGLALIGSAVWSFAFVGIGYALGASYNHFDHDFRYAEYAIVAGVILLAAYLVYRWRSGAKSGPSCRRSRSFDGRRRARAADPQARSRLPRGSRGRELHPWPALLGVSGGGCRLPWRQADARSRERHRSARLALDAMGSAPATRPSPAFTLYATAEAVVRRRAIPVFAEIDPVRSTSTSMSGREGHRPDEGMIPVHLGRRDRHVARSSSSASTSSRTRRRRWRAGSRAPRQASRPSASFRRRTSSASATVASSPPMTRSCGTHEDPRVPRSRDKTTSRARRYNSRLDEMQAAFLRIFLAELDGWNGVAAPPPPAMPSSASASSSRSPRTSPATSTTSSSVARLSAIGSRAALAEAGIASATYYTTPLHLRRRSVPRLRPARCPRPSRPAPRTSPSRSGRGCRPRRRNASSRRCARRQPRRSRCANLLSRHRLLELSWTRNRGSRGGLHSSSGSTRVDFSPSRCTDRTILSSSRSSSLSSSRIGFYNRWWRYVSIRDMWWSPRCRRRFDRASTSVVHFRLPGEQCAAPALGSRRWTSSSRCSVAGSRVLART